LCIISKKKIKQILKENFINLKLGSHLMNQCMELEGEHVIENPDWHKLMVKIKMFDFPFDRNRNTGEISCR